MNYKFIIHILGRILLVFSAFMFTIIPWIFYFHEQELLKPVLLSISIPVTIGIIILLLVKNMNKVLTRREGYLIVSSVWVLMGIIGSLPFYLSGAIPSWIDAYFESISGFTTTGSSILTDIEALPKSILYWRSLTHWIGGIGIVILVIAILPVLRIAGYQLFSMESSGTMFEKIKPRTREVAKRLWGIYLMLTVILVGLLMIGKVNFFESLTLAFGTVATGGFAVTNDSVEGYIPYVQYMIMIFMLLSGMNFTLHYFLLKGDFKKVIHNTELKAYLGIILTVGLAITFILFFSTDLDVEMSFRESFFQVISIITATGFATADYMEWKEIAWVLIFALMFVGASVGSTGGGIKVIRHVVAFKQIKNFTKKLLHPNSVEVIKINEGRTIPDANANSILTFILVYLGIFTFGSLFMATLGLDFETSMGSVITTMGGIGPGIGTVGPASNFAHIPDIGKLFLTLMMITGRLEIITFWIIFSRAFWKK